MANASPDLVSWLQLSWSRNWTIILLLVLVLCIAILRQALLPKLYPGIPHHPTAGRGILGDLPGLITHAKHSGGQVVDYLSMQCIELKSPIIQLALKPLSRPMILVDDHTTAEDILTKRTRDFDRGQVTIDMFSHLVSQSSLVMRTNDRFKSQRRLWNGTMSPAFLNRVAAPHMYTAFTNLVSLWKIKSEMAKGRPFEVIEDLNMATLDAIWSIAHGSELGSLTSQVAFLSSRPNFPLPASKDVAVDFPRTKPPPISQAMHVLVASVSASHPFPGLRRLYFNCSPSFRRARAIKDAVVAKLLSGARQKFADGLDVDEKITSAMDYVIGKEAGQVTIDDRSMRDEAFTFILAGRETMSTTLQWLVKLLAENQDVQQTLREKLSDALPLGATASDIVQANIPYLDAFVHELLRAGRTTSAVLREAQVDTQILGYAIPKGSQVILSTLQDSYLVDETLEKPAIPEKVGHRTLEKTWAAKGKRELDPTRWLITANGTEVFDPTAGPSLPFSVGIRGCFGKRLALLELRVAVAVLTQNLRFEPVPESLGSDKAYEIITRMPVQCFIRPVEI